MSHYPYTAPTAPIVQPSAEPIAVYSPMQAAMGALIGGPVGLVHFLRRNFLALGNDAAARRTLVLGAALVVALVIVLPLLPDRFPSSPLTILYVIVARVVAEKHQLTKAAIAASPEYAFRSNWNVVSMGLLCLAGSVIAIGGAVFALVMLGLVD
jgi:hypothetical protein